GPRPAAVTSRTGDSRACAREAEKPCPKIRTERRGDAERPDEGRSDRRPGESRFGVEAADASVGCSADQGAMPCDCRRPAAPVADVQAIPSALPRWTMPAAQALRRRRLALRPRLSAAARQQKRAAAVEARFPPRADEMVGRDCLKCSKHTLR